MMFVHEYFIVIIYLMCQMIVSLKIIVVIINYFES